MKRSTNLSHFGRNDARRQAEYLVRTMRAVGMTDDEIRKALEDLVGGRAASTDSTPNGEPSPGQPSGNVVERGMGNSHP